MRGYTREYTALLATDLRTPDAHATMKSVVDALWGAFNRATTAGGISWIGFYLPDPADAGVLVLGPRRDKPACSPIGLHGACGRCYTSGLPLVVTDVANLGAGYIACDARDRSEVVVPLLDAWGRCTGVLDADSYDTGAFAEHDARQLHELLCRAGLSHGQCPAVQTV